MLMVMPLMILGGLQIYGRVIAFPFKGPIKQARTLVIDETSEFILL